jgi:hypothetical protein
MCNCHPVICHKRLIVYSHYFPDDGWIAQPKHFGSYVNKVQ